MGTRGVTALLSKVYPRYIRLGFGAYGYGTRVLVNVLTSCFGNGNTSLRGYGKSMGCSPFGGPLMGNGRGRG